MTSRAYAELLAHARFPRDARTLAFAGVIAKGLASGEYPLIRGMSDESFQGLMSAYFPQMFLENGVRSTPRAAELDEYQDLLALLLDYRAEPSVANTWLCHAIASAAMRDEHLWQDMGLPNRKVLSQVLEENFPMLATMNIGDMKWKKFFYRQLCQRAEVPICKSPNCADCSDYGLCFGQEEAVGSVADGPAAATFGGPRP